MTSILDQYERASIQAGTTSFLNTLLDRDKPMFTKQKVSFTPQCPIYHGFAQSGKLALVLADDTLLRIDTRTMDRGQPVDLAKSFSGNLKTYKTFMDPLGNHLIISAVAKDKDKKKELDSSAELYYLHTSLAKPRIVSKNKGQLVTAVAWGRNSSSASTGPMLLGTSKGLVFEAELNPNGTELYWKQVFDLGRGSPVCITGLEYFRMSSESDPSISYGILVTTPTRLYQFRGSVGISGNSAGDERPLLLPIFQLYLNIPEKYIEIPSEASFSQLHAFWPLSNDKKPSQIAWASGSGILLAQIASEKERDMVLAQHHSMIPYPVPSEEEMEASVRRRGSSKIPLSLVLTEFHLVMLFHDRLRIICTINQQLVYEDLYDQSFGDLRGLAFDIRNSQGRTVWSFADYALFRYSLHDESRHVWEIYMEQGHFDLALQFCGDDETHRAQVLLKQAHYAFNKKQYDKAARLYAQTDASFEEVALKLMDVKEEDALQTFLFEKALRLKGEQRMQLSMLVLWLLELMLYKLGSLKDGGHSQDSREYREAWDSLLRFTEQKRIMDCVKSNLGALYSLLSSHGLSDAYLHFATVLKDNHHVLEQHLLDNNYTAALQVLQQDGQPELVYTAAPVLLKWKPKETVNMLISHAARLETHRVTPILFAALTDSNTKMACEIIRYVEHCVHNLRSKDKALHTLLFALYVRYQPEKTLQYLNSQGEDLSAVPYDAQAALRLCLAADTPQLQACVLLYRIMGQYQPAVEMALKVDAALARHTADMPEDNEELRKKLWLRIARHVVEKEKDVQHAMAVLQQCQLLKIEDVLPFFPDFTTIDVFKDAISQSLQEYSNHLEGLKEEMEEATKAAEAIREEIHSFRQRFIVSGSQSVCCLCRFPLLTRASYLFPCGHKFHADCLLPEVLANMSQVRREKVQELQRELASLPSGKEDSVSVGSTTFSVREQLIQDLDDIIAGDCLYCGEAMIRNIDAPFVTDVDILAAQWD